jgi:uncharacterized membrane protein
MTVMRTRRFASERAAVLVALGIASLISIGLEAVREVHYGSSSYRFMLPNLVLAWIPFLLALVLYDRYRRGSAVGGLVPLAVLWLLFLPNAPYTMTDFVHLEPSTATPLWFDGVTLSAFGWTGLLLGFVSIYLMHAVARHRFGARAAWYGVFVVFGLVSAGIYLGRVMRWNSWDLIVQPGRRVAELAAHMTDPGAVARATAITLVCAAALTVAYFVFYVLVGVRLNPERYRR